MSACGTTQEATPLPTTVPTPLTDIRFEPTAIPAGLPGNPLQMVIQPAVSELYIEPEVTEEPGVGEVLLPASSTQTELDLEEAILNYTNVTVDVISVKSPAQALTALCDATDTVSAVWVDGVAFSAALAQNCGEPIYVVQKRVNNRLQNGESGLIILTREINNPQLDSLNGGTFCRIGLNDFYTWLLPLMVFRANNIDTNNFEAVIEYDDAESLVEAVVSGECTGAGISGSDYDALIADNEELTEDISVAFTSPPIPYAVLMYPVEIQLVIRVSLNDGLLELIADDDANDLLSEFLGHDDLEVVDLDDFADYDVFLDEVGIDFAILGN